MIQPAEVFPVGEFIADEMEARGWSFRDLAERMGDGESVDVWELAMRLQVEVGDKYPNAVLGQKTADGLAHAFGTSADIWMNLDASYRRWRNRDQQPPPATGEEGMPKKKS